MKEFAEMNKYEKLSLLASPSDKVYNQWMAVFAQEKVEPDLENWGIGIIWHYHELFALDSIFNHNNVIKAKQHFYTCARLDELGIKKYDSKVLDYGIDHLSYALLSDETALIRRYADLRHSTYNQMVKSGGTAPMLVLQSLIRDDWDGYEQGMKVMKTKLAAKSRMELDANFYEALAEKDQTKMEMILAEFVTPKVHALRNKKKELINQFISHPALGYAKLAWIKGFEVKVNSPLVPEALLPVRPNEHYTGEYAFLREPL